MFTILAQQPWSRASKRQSNVSSWLLPLLTTFSFSFFSILVFLSLSLSLFLLLSTTQAQAATPFTTNGNFSVGSDGSANYSIPIQVPPGTAGMAPTLSLNYSSKGGNGILGMGWGLDGLSQISRCPRTIVQDGAVSGVNYDANDKFCIDGQRLISTGGTYGGNGTEYRTETANFAKIVSDGNGGAGPGYFKVWTKSGQIIEYGYTADARIEAAGIATVRTWGVNKISDTKGNYLTVSYLEDNANGEAYVSRVDYTGNAGANLSPYASVQFIYETRPDLSMGYHAGSVMKSTKRMTNIKTYANTSTLVKDYRLSYEQSTATQRSRLKTLTECDGNGACLALNTMNWKATNAGSFASNTNFQLPNYLSDDKIADIGSRLLDLNGDGLQDYIYARYLSSTNAINVAWLNTGSGWIESSSYRMPVNISADNIQDLGVRFVDLNGDGLVDIVYGRWMSSTSGFLQAWINTGTGWVESPNYAPPTHIVRNASSTSGTTSDLGTKFVDLNGDGLQDFVYARYLSATDNRSSAWLNTGNGWVSAPQFAPPIHIVIDGNKDSGVRFVDLNGDGLEDIVYGRWISSSLGYLQAWINTGTGWVESPNYAPPTHIVRNASVTSETTSDLGTRFVDLNGDGLQDFVYARYLSATDYRNQAWLNTGKGWISAPQYILPSHISADGFKDLGTRFVDVNGDGLQDFVYARWINATTNYLTTWINTSNGWVSTASMALPTYLSDDKTSDIGARLIDLNGDGIDDMVYSRWWGTNGSSSFNLAWLNTSVKDALASISSGLGASVSLTYSPLTNKSIYTKGVVGEASTTVCPQPSGEGNVANGYPILNIQDAQYVVSSVSSNDGIGGASTDNYTYGGNKVHLLGRGGLGFRWQVVTEPNEDTTSTTFFRKDYPFIGMPCQTEQRIASSNTLVGISQLTYATSPLTTGSAVSQFPYLTQSIQQSFELGGSLVSTTTTSNQYDTYGNVTKIIADSNDGYIKTTTNTYYNDSNNWILGRLLRSTVSSTSPGTTPTVTIPTAPANPPPNTNVSPTVTLTAPANNSSIATGTAITVSATAADSDGTVAKVEFYDGTTLIGTDTSSPYSMSWTNAAVGSHTITAKAYDNGGATKTSTAVVITVTP